MEDNKNNNNKIKFFPPSKQKPQPGEDPNYDGYLQKLERFKATSYGALWGGLDVNSQAGQPSIVWVWLETKDERDTTHFSRVSEAVFTSMHRGLALGLDNAPLDYRYFFELIISKYFDEPSYVQLRLEYAAPISQSFHVLFVLPQFLTTLTLLKKHRLIAFTNEPKPIRGRPVFLELADDFPVTCEANSLLYQAIEVEEMKQMAAKQWGLHRN